MTSINAKTLKKLFANGTRQVEANFEYIDELNVFPVPDGDTGTNLKITTTGAYETIKDMDTEDISLLSKTFARGLLMNARGNSGVIFSQIFKGFSTAFAPGCKEVSMSDMIKAFNNAKEFAYRSVATPVEGTILTVIRVTAEKLLEGSGKFLSLEQLFETAAKEAKIILDKTPDFLIQLKEVGVVDSGGYGIWCFIQGMYDALAHPENLTEIKKEEHVEKTSSNINKNFVDNNEGFGYCSEFIMKLGSRVTVDQQPKKEFDEPYFKKTIEEMGNSFVYVKDDDIVKVHVHVTEPYKLLEFAAQYGEFNKIKIENMTMQFLMKNKNTSLEKATMDYNANNEIVEETRVVATVPSAEIAKVYASEFGINNTLNCDQVGNPTIQQFYDLMKSARSRHVICVTDNGNVLMAAEQAAKLFPKKNYNIQIVPSKDIATSYLTCLTFNPELERDDIFKVMEKNFKNTISGKISKSVKNIRYKNLNIKIGDIISVINKDITYNSRTVGSTARALANQLFNKIKKPRTCVIIYGKDTVLEDVHNLATYINQNFLIKPILIAGNQATYQYYIGVAR